MVAALDPVHCRIVVVRTRRSGGLVDWWDPSIAVAGLLVGFVVGLTGMGGGALMTPMLVLFFGVQPLAAVSSDLVASFFMKPVGGVGAPAPRHRQPRPGEVAVHRLGAAAPSPACSCCGSIGDGDELAGRS